MSSPASVCFLVYSCDGQENAAIDHDWSIRGSVESCGDWKDSLWLDVHILEQSTWDNCHLSPSVAYSISVAGSAGVVARLLEPGQVEAEL